AHDFNNLLTIMRASADFLCQPDLSEDRRRRYVDALSEAVERGTALVRQLLAFARREPLQAEVFDAAQCALRLVDGLRSVVGPGIKVVADLPERPCWVSTDVAQFESAIINLAVNARDAMNGEGTLIIRVAAGPAPPNSIQGTAVAVSVSDTGIGIPPDKLQQVFEPFFTTKGPGKGTGLGLSQVYGYIKESGGDVRVASAPGEGAVFTLYLPQIEAPEKQDPVRESIDR
ncbi:MAG TPA: ATP-binding protein, partial [Roseiarcus sp.]|nr:ATP-binding protein [Roseiarcus sp.]